MTLLHLHPETLSRPGLRGLPVGLAAAGVGLALGALPFPEFLLAAGGVGALVGAALRPQVALYLALLSVPFSSIMKLEAGGFSISLTEPLVALLLMGWLARAFVRRELQLRGSVLLIALLGFGGLAMLSASQAYEWVPALKELFKWAEIGVVFLFVSSELRSEPAIRRALWVVVIAASAQALFGLYQVATGTGPEHFAVGTLQRAFGHFDQPNPFAGYLGTALPLAVVLIAVTPFPGRLLAVLGTLTMAVALVASQSRGGWLALLLGGAVMLVAWNRRTRAFLPPVAAVTLLTAALAMAGALPPALVDRFAIALDYFGFFDARLVPPTPENWSVVERMAHWQAGWYMFLDHPLLGVGPGNYAAVYERYFLPGWPDPLGHAHNYYLNIAAESGILAAIAFVALLAVAIGTLGRSLGSEHRHPFWHPLRVGVLGFLVVLVFHNMFDNLLVHSMGVQFGFALGLISLGRGPSEQVASV